MQENGSIPTGLGQQTATSPNLTFPRTHEPHGGMVYLPFQLKLMNLGKIKKPIGTN